ncbi:UPAR/Ly6 domain-containing protein cold-like [Watersipora subatra]|uniref:UPAR/Ly6 domain-containing protein cold-like n=1 Tax=Watersipora subatra TaxID=2589382 RepID=UPI00355B4199
MNKLIIVLVSIVPYLNFVEGNQCYVCTAQEQNDDKCIKTVNTCLPSQSACMTKVEWRFPPYWTPGGVRIHYITKSCDEKDDCDRKKESNRQYCKRDWWNDWTCYDCCNGQRCNYYVTLGAGSVRPQWAVLSLTLLSILMARIS